MGERIRKQNHLHGKMLLHIWKSTIDINFFFFQQTNPFDLFETFFGPSMGGFSGMDQTGFRTRRRTTVSKGEDIRWVKILMTLFFAMMWSLCANFRAMFNFGTQRFTLMKRNVYTSHWVQNLYLLLHYEKVDRIQDYKWS